MKRPAAYSVTGPPRQCASDSDFKLLRHWQCRESSSESGSTQAGPGGLAGHRERNRYRRRGAETVSGAQASLSLRLTVRPRPRPAARLARAAAPDVQHCPPLGLARSNGQTRLMQRMCSFPIVRAVLIESSCHGHVSSGGSVLQILGSVVRSTIRDAGDAGSNPALGTQRSLDHSTLPDTAIRKKNHH